MALLTFTSAGPQPQPRQLDLHRQLIGHIGLWLPLILIGLVLWRDGEDVWMRLDSVSAYYYSGAVAAFTGMLVVLALFLFTYDGYRNDDAHWADRACAVTAGAAALLAAFFPTSAPEGITALDWVEPWVAWIHYGSAVLLFGMFAVFCLWLFRKKAKGQAQAEARGEAKPDPDREKLNRFYLACGLAIIACIAWAFFNGLRDVSIFWPESWALIFFAASWLVKGYSQSPVAKRALSWLHKATPKVVVPDDEEMSRRGR